jgi:hypothetical protein
MDWDRSDWVCGTDDTALCLPGYPQLVSTTSTRFDALPSSPSSVIQAFPSSHLYQVSPPLSPPFLLFPFTLSPMSRGEAIADTRSQAESVIAPYLTELQARVKKEGIRVGSCEYQHSVPRCRTADFRSVPV